MDSAAGTYMSYNNDASTNEDYSNLFNDLSHNATPSNDSAFDPALLEQNGLDSFAQQPQSAQHPQQNFNQNQRQTQSQSPAIQQYKAAPNAYPMSQYGANPYSQPSMYDPQYMVGSAASPVSFDHFPYQSPPPNLGYTQQPFNYYQNSFGPQLSNSNQSAQFRPQSVAQTQAQAQHYLNMNRQQQQQPQAHISQIQNINSMSYPFQQNQQMHRFIDPAMLNSEGQAQAAASTPNQPGLSPYFPKANVGQTLDPRTLSMQQYAQMSQVQNTRMDAQTPTNLQVQQKLHSLMQFPIQGPIQAQGTPMHTVVKRSKTSGNDADSDDDLEIEDEEPPEPRPASITIAKPTDERGKLLWEMVDAVWFPRNKPASSEKIRTAVKFVGDAIRGLRDTWKDSNDQLKKAENSKQQTEGLKLTVANYREIMETAVSRIARFGHPSILKRLGENLILLSALYSFLLDRVNVDDYESTLVVNILKLGTQLETVDEEQLEKVKWTKILGRFVKKCKNDSKLSAQQILNNAKKATARKKAEAAGQGPASPSSNSSSQVTGVKRPREGGDGAQPAKKLPVKQSSKPLSVQLAEQRKLKEKEKAATAVNGAKSDKIATNGPAATARPKVTAVPLQKASPFAGLLSASKKPGTTNAERAAKEKVEAAKSVVPTNPSTMVEPTPKSEIPAAKITTSAPATSSFLGFLSEMDKPKEAPKQKVEEDPNETAEARAKRLRKESRRKLRVSWKPESELVETKIFEHDPDEETGHEDSQMRDVGDSGKEGEMLKKGIQSGDLEDDDSDDEDIAMEYFAPSEVDFSTMKQKPEDDFDQVNFTKTGGHLSPKSPASKAQDEMEYGKEMAIYRPGEQPSSPREPPEADDDDFDPIVDFGEPQEPRVRQREQQVLAHRQAYPQAQPPLSNGFDLASALSSLQPQHTQQATQTDWLQALGLSAQPQQTQAQPQLDLSTILAMAQQMQQNNAYQATAPAPVPASNTSVAPDVAAILTQLGGLPQAGQQQYTAPLPVGSGDNPNPFPGSSEQSSKKKDKKRNKGGVPLNADGLPYNYKTKVCQFWLEGKCTKGDACTYRHDREGVDSS